MKFISTKGYRVLRVFVLAAFRLVHPRVVVKGKENIPQEPCILCGNHSAFSDPVWLVGYGNFPDLPRVMAKQELKKIPVMGWIFQKLRCIYVNRDGNDIPAIKAALKTLRDGNNLVLFPEGTRIRRGKKSEPHSGAMMFASRSGCPVVPVYITARKRLFRAIHVIFGKPITPQFAGSKPTAEELEQETKRLMDTIYGLGEGT